MVGKEKVCYWLSKDIVGLVGLLVQVRVDGVAICWFFS